MHAEVPHGAWVLFSGTEKRSRDFKIHCVTDCLTSKVTVAWRLDWILEEWRDDTGLLDSLLLPASLSTFQSILLATIVA